MTQKAQWRFDADALLATAGLAGQEFPPGALYVVATPIGNAADLTLRALWVLAHVDVVAAEDTRSTRPLLARFDIHTPLLSAHRHNERAAADALIARLRAGQRVALVSDAGTPAVSDPGARIVRAMLDAGVRVVPIPGASSVLAAWSAAGLSGGGFRFAGFVPTAARERAALLRAVAADAGPTVLFEAPHRIAATAAELAGLLPPHRRVVVARELTKRFESIVAVAAADLAAAIAADAGAGRGEYVLLIDQAEHPDRGTGIDAVTRRWLEALATELPASRAASVAARASGLPRALLYRALTEARAGCGEPPRG
jgi:16S rRNA (cytidine1402-2'-O)-methyltransferase